MLDYCDILAQQQHVIDGQTDRQTKRQKACRHSRQLVDRQ